MTTSTASPAPSMATASEEKLPLFSLTAMVIGSMVGAGIFNLPGRFATATGPFGAIIAWAIAGTGMYMLARVFQALAEKRPDIDSGIFAYAKAGFGDYMGFLSAFGYWLGSCLGNVFYWVLISSTLGRFFPDVFGDGSTATAIIVSLVGIWAFHFMILRGIEQATFINTIVTVAKIVPIIVAIIAFVFFFNYSHFSENFFGGVGMPEKSLVAQVRDTMLITVFVFLGIEGASVYSRFAKKRSDVGSATILGFVAVTGLMVAVTLLPYATAPRAAIAGVPEPLPRRRPGTGRRALGGGVHLHRRADLGARRLSRLVVDLRGSALRRRQVKGHAPIVRGAEWQPGARQRALAHQHRRLAVRDLDLLVARRLQLHARHDQRHGAAALSARRRIWRAACAQRGGL